MNVTVSPAIKVFWFRYTTPSLLAPPDDGEELLFVTTLPTAPLSDPIIFSPIIASVPTLDIEENSIASSVGSAVFVDSYTTRTFATSGTFSEICSS